MKIHDIVIVGAGGLAREVAWLIQEINRKRRTWNCLGYVERPSEAIGQSVGKLSVCMHDDMLATIDRKISVAIAVGTPSVVFQIKERLQANDNITFPNLIHPGVIWDRERIQIGIGNIICVGNIITTDITIGNFNILNPASTYGHDDIIGDCNIFNPGCNISGRVRVGDRCLVGTGAVILENLSLGNDIRVGGGAVVTKNVDSGLTVVGVPAKPLVRSI